jgi:hypothetical protein
LSRLAPGSAPYPSRVDERERFLIRYARSLAPPVDRLRER